MTWWHCPTGAQGMAGYSPRYYGFDFSALPYLLRLIPGPSPSGRLRSVVPSRPRPCQSGKSHEQRSGVSPVGKGGRSWTVSPPWSSLPVGDRIVLLAYHYVSGSAREAHIVATPSAGPSFYREAVHWGPRVYEPDNTNTSI